MGFIKSLNDSISGVFADQWREIITVNEFNETAIAMPGVFTSKNHNRGINDGSLGVITNGSLIYVPDNTIAVIMDGSSIEGVITEPGEFEYHNGEKSILSKNSIAESIINTVNERFDFGGQPNQQKKVLFLNLREIRNLKYGTPGPVLVHDVFYDVDLEIIMHGMFSVQLVKPLAFVQNYLPANTYYYDMGEKASCAILQAELIEAIASVINEMAKDKKVSELLSLINDIKGKVEDYVKKSNWEERFGIELSSFSIKNIELTSKSKDIINNYAEKRLGVTAFSNLDSKVSDVAFKQKIASGIEKNGIGEGGVVLAMDMMKNLSSDNSKSDIQEQIKLVKELKVLLDEGILSKDEFESKKKEIMGL